MANGIIYTDSRKLISRNAQSLQQLFCLTFIQGNVLRHEIVFCNINKKVTFRKQVQVEDGLEFVTCLEIIGVNIQDLTSKIGNLVLDNDNRRGNLLLLHTLHQSILSNEFVYYALIAETPKLGLSLKWMIMRSFLFDSFTPYKINFVVYISTTTESSSYAGSSPNYDSNPHTTFYLFYKCFVIGHILCCF